MNKTEDIIKVFDKDLIFLNIPSQTKEEFFDYAGTMLFEKGIVTENWRTMALDREINFPTGLPCGEMNIAIPHTDSKYVKKDAIVIFVPNNPIKFFNMGDYEKELDIFLILPICFSDPKKGLSLYPYLLEIFAKQETIATIRNCKNSDEVYKYLKIIL